MRSVYNYFRDCYDPATGRYCQFDPIGLAGGLNGYLYANANPLTYTDPLGLTPAIPAGPVPLPLPPVFIPGTPENQAFTDSTIRGINAFSDWVKSLTKSALDECEEDCEKQYDRDMAECRAYSAMTGNKYTFVACKREAERRLSKCMSDCGKSCKEGK